MTLSNEELQRRLNEEQWTAHNIRLTPDLTTMPGQPDFMLTDLRLKAILRALSFVYRGRLEGLRVADLGCLEGGFALALAQRGMKVMGVEARQRNLDKALLLKEHFDLPELEFVRDDVKNFTREKFGSFDVVLALGILYHLDRPVEWLSQIAEATRGLLVIESHYAPADKAAMKLLDRQFKRLGHLKQVEALGNTYEGRWFFEYGPKGEPENQLWASYSNGSSFWLTRESLLRATLRAGFDLVWEQHDYSADFYQLLNFRRSRALFCALKSSAFTGG